MNADAPPNPFLTLWEMGYRRLTPITPPGCELWPESTIARLIAAGKTDSRGKAPGVRRGDKWVGYPFLDRAAREEDLEEWRAMGAGVGVLTGGGVVGIDADCLRPFDADVCRGEIETRIGRLPTRIGRAPKALFVCRTDPDFNYARLLFGEGERIEILSEGRQFVAHGTHPGTLQPYRWIKKLCPVEELPYASPAALLDLLEALKVKLPAAKTVERSGGGGEAPDQEGLKGDLETVGRAVAATPNTSEAFPSREDYLNYGYALKAALADHPAAAFDLFFEWCERWKDDADGRENELETVASDWRRMKPPFRIGAGWLYEKAERASGGSFSRAAMWFERPKMGRATPWRFPDPATLPTRKTLYGGHYARKWVSSTIAPSKVGKSSLALVEALAMASGRPLLGVQPAGVFRVWWWNGEDPQDELDRRVAAAIQHYGLTREDLSDRLFVDNGRETPIRLAVQERSGAKLVEVESNRLIADISENQIDVTIIDPFISAHRVSENDNNAIDLTAKECNRIADVTNSAIELVHHTRKLYGEGATVEDGRGASALLATTRSTRALAKMTADEARELGVGLDRRLLFRFADVSSNISAPDPNEATRWFKLQSVSLGNGEGAETMDKITNGDSVGVATRFDLADARKGAMADVAEDASREAAALAAVRGGQWRADVRSSDWVGIPISQAFGIARDTPGGVLMLKNIIREWMDHGKLIEENRMAKNRQMKVFVTAPVRGDDSDLFA